MDGVGDILLTKRKGSKNARLSIRADGRVRVNLPAWSSYAAGLAFAKAHKRWIISHRPYFQRPVLKNGDQFYGKYHLKFNYTLGAQRITATLGPRSIVISSSLAYDHPSVQNKAYQSCEKALRAEAKVILPKRLEQLSRQYGFKCQDVKIRKLTARWGSCSKDKKITLSYYLLQLSPDLRDYVILHELVHTKHLNHGPDFWQLFQSIYPQANQSRKHIRNFRPRLAPLTT